MSPKWTTFLVLNILLLIVVGFIIFNYAPRLFEKTGQGLYYSIIFLFQLCGVVFNNVINIYIIISSFPDKLLSKKIKDFLIFPLILDITAMVTAAAVIGEGLGDETIYLAENNESAIITLSSFALFIILTLYFVLLRFQIEGHLKIKHARKIIAEIGE
jgi:hypothetical protein